MDDEKPTEQGGGGTTVPETGAENKDIGSIAATLPPLGSDKAGGPVETKPAPEPKRYREGRPCSATKIAQGKITPCGNCSTCDRLSRTGGKLLGAPLPKGAKKIVVEEDDDDEGELEIENVPGGQPNEAGAPGNIADFTNYGLGGVELLKGVVARKISPLRAEIFSKVPSSQISRFESLLDALRVPDDQLPTFQTFYAGVAMEFGLPPGGGLVLHALTLHWSTFRTLNEGIDSIRSELAKLNSPNP